jgi:hypothetical protein
MPPECSARRERRFSGTAGPSGWILDFQLCGD